MIVSGVLRNRLRIDSVSRDPRGFVWDKNRMPPTAVDNGTAVLTGAFWDGNVDATKDRFNIPEVSGQLVYTWSRSNIQKGLGLLQAGIGDNQDLELSRIIFSGTNYWQPIIKTGTWFDLDNKVYLYGDSSVELIVSGTNKITNISSVPQHNTPVSLASFHVDPWGRKRHYEDFRHKQRFTSTSTSNETLELVSGVYEQKISGIQWAYVNSGLYELMVDQYEPAVVRSRNITSGVQATLQRAPWSQQKFQLPLIPVVELSGIPTYQIYADMVNISGGLGTPGVVGSGVSGLTLTSGSYVRASGSVALDATTIQVDRTISGVFPATGTILLDGGDYRQEQVAYTSISGLYFSGLTRNNAAPHRDGAQIRLVVSASLSGNTISGVTGSGMYYADYTVSGLPYSINKYTGLVDVPQLSGIHRVLGSFDYERGLLLCYEPSGASKIYTPSGVNVNPLLHGENHGLLYASLWDLNPAKVTISTSRGFNSDGTVGPIYAGNDYLSIEAKVVNQLGAPVPNSPVVLALEDPSNIGLVDGADPVANPSVKVTDGAGVARFTYTPPDTIQGLGYFADTVDIINGSGLRLREDIPLGEIWESGNTWKTLLFSIWTDDAYLDYTEVSGEFSYEVDGRFELVTQISGQDVYGVNTWHPVYPTAVLDGDLNQITPSGATQSIRVLVFPSGSIPTDANIGAYFISAEKRISIGAVVQGTNAASQSFETVLEIPPFMKGDFYWGPIDDPDTKAFDSLAYLTINPFQQIDPNAHRSDPRVLGNVFMIRGTNTGELLRNKLYVNINVGDLLQSSDGRQKLKQAYMLRNRVIIEVE